MNFISRKLCVRHSKILQQSSFFIRTLSQIQDAKDLINNQLEFKIKLPKAKEWSDTAILHALAETVKNELTVSLDELESPYFWYFGKYPPDRKQNLARQGIATANFVMEKYPALFEHSWAADSVENWISFSADDTLQISSDATEKESSESSVAQQEISQDSPSIIHQCIDHKKVSAATQEIVHLLKNDKDISPDLLNQFLGLFAFYKGSDVFVNECQRNPVVSVIPKPIEDVDQEGNIAALFNALKPSSLDQLSTLIMSIPNTGKKNSSTVLSLYQKGIKGRKVDVDVYNHVLILLKFVEVGKRADLAFDILKTMKQNGVKPNYETFVHFARIASPQHSKLDGFVKFCQQVLSEMKEIGIRSNLAVVSSLIGAAASSRLEEKLQLVSGLLDYIADNQHYSLDLYDIAAFNDLVANCSFNLSLIKKIFDVSQRGTNYLLLSSNPVLAYTFYSRIFVTVLKKDTIENTFYYMQRFVPLKIQLNSSTLKIFLNRVKKEKRPEYLPTAMLREYCTAVVSDFKKQFENMPSKKYYKDFEVWLRAALHTLDVADADTKTQMKNIAMMEIMFPLKKDENLGIIMNLCLELLFETTGEIRDIAKGFEHLIYVAREVEIYKNHIDRFRTLAIEQRREIDANRILKRLENARKSTSTRLGWT